MVGDDNDAEAVKLLRALLAIAIDERERRIATESGARRTEVILDMAGLDSSTIATLVGKQAGSVRMTLSRARKGGANSKEDGDG